jgi:hypothetical protein
MITIKYRLSPALIGASVIIVQPQVVWALSASEVDKVAESITVLIDGPGPGAGVLVKRQGNTYSVLTAYHVVKPQGKYSIVIPD